MPWETGSSLMELEFPATLLMKHQTYSGISTAPEVKWWYTCTGGEVERMGSTAVRYLMQWVLIRRYTLECTQEVSVTVTCTLLIVLFNYGRTAVVLHYKGEIAVCSKACFFLTVSLDKIFTHEVILKLKKVLLH